MTECHETPSVSDGWVEWPFLYLRRYAARSYRSQNSGDAFCSASLEAILTDRSVLEDVDTRTGVFSGVVTALGQCRCHLLKKAKACLAGQAQKHPLSY